jgi:hypothetical protein
MRTFVKRAPVAEGFTPIQVVELSYQVLLNWLQRIQPVIRKLPNRLDRNWSWSRLYRYLPLVEQMRGRNLAGYAIHVKNDHGDAVPAGLVLLSLGYPALDDHREQSLFLWYLTAAPIEALQDLKVSAKPRLLEILVDIALVVSEAQGYSGRIGLHAANEAGNPEAQKFLQNYQTRCQLLSLPMDVKMPSMWRRNDGRYFYTTPLVAQERMAALDYLC